MARSKTYILKIDSYTGDNTARDHHEILDNEGWNVQEVDAIYAIVSIQAGSAEIVDDGYRSLAEAQEAWFNALPQKVNNGIQQSQTQRQQ